MSKQDGGRVVTFAPVSLYKQGSKSMKKWADCNTILMSARERFGEHHGLFE